MALSMSWSSGGASKLGSQVREWYGHFAGITPLWSRLAVPVALATAWLGNTLQSPAVLLPFLVAPLAAGYYAGFYVGLRAFTVLPLRRLKQVDLLLLAGAAACSSLTLDVLAPDSLESLLWLPGITLFAVAWHLNWRQGSEHPTGPGSLPAPPRFLQPAEGRITAGYRSYDRTHTGVDLAVARGTPVVSPAPGQIMHAGPWDQWGYCVAIEHGGGWSTLLAHLERPLVRPGAVVVGGACIGLSGSSGISTGPHLHVELRYRGVAVDPSPLLQG